MQFILPTLPKLDFGIDNFFKNYAQNPRTLDWTKGSVAVGGGTGGYFYNGPIATLAANGVVVPKATIENYSARIRQDYIDRGILEPGIFKADFKQLLPYKPVGTPGGGKNLWDRLHKNIKILRDLSDAGFHWPRDFAARIVQSVYNSKDDWLNLAQLKFPEWGDNGRHRGLAGCVHLLVDMFHIYKAVGTPEALALAKETLQLLAATVEMADQKWPLFDLGQGDAAPVSLGPHYRNFMTAHAGSAFKRATYLSIPKAKKLWDKCVEIVLAARRGVGMYAYDQRCTPEGVPFVSADEGINDGIGEVIQWMPDCLKGSVVPGASAAYAELLAKAKAANWPSKYPMTMCSQFGTL